MNVPECRVEKASTVPPERDTSSRTRYINRPHSGAQLQRTSARGRQAETAPPELSSTALCPDLSVCIHGLLQRSSHVSWLYLGSFTLGPFASLVSIPHARSVNSSTTGVCFTPVAASHSPLAPSLGQPPSLLRYAALSCSSSKRTPSASALGVIVCASLQSQPPFSVDQVASK